MDDRPYLNAKPGASALELEAGACGARGPHRPHLHPRRDGTTAACPGFGTNHWDDGRAPCRCLVIDHHVHHQPTCKSPDSAGAIAPSGNPTPGA